MNPEVFTKQKKTFHVDMIFFACEATALETKFVILNDMETFLSLQWGTQKRRHVAFLSLWKVIKIVQGLTKIYIYRTVCV